MTSNLPSQWLFPLSALQVTPSQCSLAKELYNRARGVEFLFRLGSSLGLPTAAMNTAATWFHRFYMRYAMEDFHRQDVAATCIFLATKTEECGRKLADVARVYQAKVANVNVNHIPAESKEVELCQSSILQTEEYLLEALCFDFIVESPHAELVDLFDSQAVDFLIQEYAWSLAHDSYRVPLCILYTPRIIAAACYVLAQRIFDGPGSPSLDARISASAPSNSLPTPPLHKAPSPDATRYVIEYYSLNENELMDISDALGILLEFYGAQDKSTYPYLDPITSVPPPTRKTERPVFYLPAEQALASNNNSTLQVPPDPAHAAPGTTLNSNGGLTPLTNVD